MAGVTGLEPAASGVTGRAESPELSKNISNFEEPFEAPKPGKVETARGDPPPENGTAAPGAKSRDGGNRVGDHHHKKHLKNSAPRAGAQRLSDGVAVYAGRVCIGAFVETASGFLVLGPDGRSVQAVAKRAEAQRLLWEASGGGLRP